MSVSDRAFISDSEVYRTKTDGKTDTTPMGRELCLSRKLETAKQAAQCLSRADSSLLDLCALSSVWLLPGQEVGIPWAGKYCGRLGVLGMLQTIQANCRVEGAEAAPLLESGSQVIIPHLSLFLNDCQNGVPLTLIMEVKDELVTKCWFHYDEADVTELYREAGHTLAPKSMQGVPGCAIMFMRRDMQHASRASQNLFH